MRTKIGMAIAALGIALAGAVPAKAEQVVKLGLLLDMSSVYADITGAGSELAARMAVEDFGGKVLGRPIQVLVADHLNKSDVASAQARQWFDEQHVDSLMDVAASATALAAMRVAKDRNKIVILNGPGASSITNENCIPTAVHYAYDTYALAHSTGKAILDEGGKTWFFLAADYTFGYQLEKDTADVVKANGGKVLGDAKIPLKTADMSAICCRPSPRVRRL